MAAAKKTTAKSKSFDAMSGLNTEAFKEGFEQMNTGLEKVAEFQKESMDAVMSASSTVAGGFEKIATEQAEFAKTNFDETVKTAQAIAQCKSPQEALDLNTEFFRSAFEKNMSQFNKVTEMVAAQSKSAVEPLTDTYANFVETVQSYRP